MKLRLPKPYSRFRNETLQAVVLSCVAHVAVALSLSFSSTPPALKAGLTHPTRVSVRLNMNSPSPKISPPTPSHSPNADAKRPPKLNLPPLPLVAPAKLAPLSLTPSIRQARLKNPTVLSKKNAAKHQSVESPKPSTQATTQKTQKNPSLASILSQPPTTSSQSKPKPSPAPGTAPGEQATSPDPALLLTAAEIQRIRHHVARFWIIPVGLQHYPTLRLEVLLHMNPDGTVKHAEVINVASKIPGSNLAQTDKNDNLRILAGESALHALAQCGPLPFPSNKYATWRVCILTFSPKEMAGVLRP